MSINWYWPGGDSVMGVEAFLDTGASGIMLSTDTVEQLRSAPATLQLATGPWKVLATKVQLIRAQISNQRSTP